MSCTYYTFRQGDYYCTKKGAYIDDDIYHRYCKAYSYDECPIYKQEESSSSCYLTSACVKAKQLPDNCEELETLRSFRDNWLKAQPCGAYEIAEYYRIAPAIVKAINEQDMALEIWADLYQRLIVPCVSWIKNGQMEQAHTLYRDTSLQLQKQYL